MADMSASYQVQEDTNLVPRIGTSVGKRELDIILLEVVQKLGYDGATEDQKKAVEAFVFGKDVFIRFQPVAENPCAILAFRMCLMNCEDGLVRTVATIQSLWWYPR